MSWRAWRPHLTYPPSHPSPFPSLLVQALKAKQDELADVEARLSALSDQLATATSKKAGLEADVALCTEKLDRAQKLIGGLGGEKVRWTEAAADLGDLYKRLIGEEGRVGWGGDGGGHGG